MVTCEEVGFDEILLDSIDEGLAIFGPQRVAYYYLESRFELRREMIPKGLGIFHKALEETFDAGAITIEKTIAKILYQKLDLRFEAHVHWTIVDYVNKAKKTNGAPTRNGVMRTEKSEILSFVRQMKPTEHVIMFYSKPEDRDSVLFTYLNAGLDQGEAAAYIACEETPDEIKEAMNRLGINVERPGALHVIDYKDWYIIGGRFNRVKTTELWKKLYDKSVAEGFKGLRVTGETSCFFKHGMVKELVEYERSLHRVLDFPVTAICAYTTDLVANEGKDELYLDLIKAHSTVIFAEPEGAVVKSEARGVV